MQTADFQQTRSPQATPLSEDYWWLLYLRLHTDHNLLPQSLVQTRPAVLASACRQWTVRLLLPPHNLRLRLQHLLRPDHATDPLTAPNQGASAPETQADPLLRLLAGYIRHLGRGAESLLQLHRSVRLAHLSELVCGRGSHGCHGGKYTTLLACSRLPLPPRQVQTHQPSR